MKAGPSVFKAKETVIITWQDYSKLPGIILSDDFYLNIFVMRCAIWYQLYNLKNVKNTHRGVLLLVKLQAQGLQFYLK